MSSRSASRRTRSGQRTNLGNNPRARRHPHTADPSRQNQPGTAGADRHQRLVSWGTALTGAAAVAALLFTGISSYQTQNELNARTQELEIARQAQISDRFTKAVSQLDDKSIDVRLGGLYALERIMNDSHDDQPAVVNVLSAYTRTHSDNPKREDSPKGVSTSAEEDILAAVKLLGARDPESDAQAAVDLHGTQLREAALIKANFDDADLSAADLRKARLDEADLRKADMSEIDLRAASLDEAHLYGANLHKADLRDAALFNADLRASLHRADLRGALLVDADLRTAYLPEADLRGADLRGADLRGADLSDADLRGAHLRDADLRGANLKRVKGSLRGAQTE